MHLCDVINFIRDRYLLQNRKKFFQSFAVPVTAALMVWQASVESAVTAHVISVKARRNVARPTAFIARYVLI